MFKAMRRIEKLMSDEDAIKILEYGSYGVLGTLDANGYPNVTPLNYAYKNGNIYFHSAVEGTKLDNIEFENKVSFTVVSYEKIIPDKFDTEYDSVIIFGKAEILKENSEKVEGLKYIIEKYSKDFMDEGAKYIKNSHHKTAVVKIKIEHMTGKIGR